MPLEEQMGDISIDHNVVGTIAAVAAQEVPGVVCVAGIRSLREMLGKKDPVKGVKVDIEENRAIIDMEVKIEFGLNMYDSAHELQRRVKANGERMTGLIVEKVNVKINGIIIHDKKERPAPPES